MLIALVSLEVHIGEILDYILKFINRMGFLSILNIDTHFMQMLD